MNKESSRLTLKRIELKIITKWIKSMANFQHNILIFFVPLLAFLSTSSCVNSAGTTMKELPTYSLSGTDYKQKGTLLFDKRTYTLKSASGCTISYTEFKPSEAEQDTLVVLGHGFFRSQKTQRQLAEHLASWGIWVATMDFCNSRPWNGHHDKNGADMLLVTSALGAQKVIYAGFSAGGLAAYIAASLDERTQAYLGLDMVDNFKKGIKAAPQIKAPVYGLVAESSACNAKNNGLDAYLSYANNNNGYSPNLLKIHGASHCDFEFPYDGKCAFACGKSRKPYSREDIQGNILGLSTSLILQHSQSNSESWWEKHHKNLIELINAKRISQIDL
jgi:dienelactone hydrolase